MEEDCCYELIDSLPIDNGHNFWKAIKLSISKPHTISRKLAGAELQVILQWKAPEINTHGELFEKVTSYVRLNQLKSIDGDSIKNILSALEFEVNLIEVNEEHFDGIKLDDDHNIYFVLSKLLPRNLKNQKSSFELIILGNFIMVSKTKFATSVPQ